MKEKFTVSGMSCAACSARVEKAVSALRGVRAADVNLLQNTLTADFDESVLSVQDIVAAVENAGYGAAPVQKDKTADNAAPQADPAAQAERHLRLRFWSSLAFLLPLFYISMGHMLGAPLPQALTQNPGVFALTQFLFLIPVLFINREIFANGLKTLFHASSHEKGPSHQALESAATAESSQCHHAGSEFPSALRLQLLRRKASAAVQLVEDLPSSSSHAASFLAPKELFLAEPQLSAPQ